VWSSFEVAYSQSVRLPEGRLSFQSRRKADSQLIAFRETTLYRQAVVQQAFLACESVNGHDQLSIRGGNIAAVAGAPKS